MVADHFVLVHHVVVFAFEALDLTLSVNALILLIILAELESVLAEEMAAKFYLRVEFDVGAERALIYYSAERSRNGTDVMARNRF
jgi:hypothetical protein